MRDGSIYTHRNKAGEEETVGTNRHHRNIITKVKQEKKNND